MTGGPRGAARRCGRVPYNPGNSGGRDALVALRATRIWSLPFDGRTDEEWKVHHRQCLADITCPGEEFPGSDGCAEVPVAVHISISGSGLPPPMADEVKVGTNAASRIAEIAIHAVMRWRALAVMGGTTLYLYLPH
jgi:hypothetical protein